MAKVEIISRESIKPSFPTPHHLTNFQLSFLDQLAPPVYVPIILFFDCNVQICTHRLKKSLSATLTRFYPLAGRIKNSVSIDCNDDGADYFEAQVTAQLSDVVAQPKADVLKQFLPCEPFYTWTGSGADVLLAIQVNVFDCGGTAIGVCISHKIADVASLATFVGTWSAISRGSTEIVDPRLDLASLFPPRDLSGFMPTTGIVKDKIVTKRFVFDASKIAALRAKAATTGTCTRVEALSTFIWRRFLALFAAERKAGTENMHVLIHAVNLRGRMDPPLPQYSFGNVWRPAITLPLLGESDKESDGLEGLVRDAIRKVDGEYVKKLEEGDEYLKNIKKTSEQFHKGEVVTFNFSSWCRFPFYEVDFGWGKPRWVSTTGLPFKNVIIFMDTKSGDGIEAWVNMLEGDMAEFEHDQELREFTSSSPS
ncbi:hypothetical protein HHK36_015748 [Tetracentron sinense]|uniref:Uncharacterized protein n=1 Tax=Tetracentron sinense TaxID=13715 RepID=A0A834Z7S9_TETSI|nr:hypothetical protein HHK36_015748 [Tetracentron sinense]